MLYHIFTTFKNNLSFLRVFDYPSFRIPMAMLTALVLTLFLFPYFLNWLKKFQHETNNIREDTPSSHQEKKGIPTMGGLFILASVTLSSILWADLRNHYIWAIIFVLLGFGAIGFYDDYKKLSKKNSKGLSGWNKIIYQILVLLILIIFLIISEKKWIPGFSTHIDTTLSLPFIAIKWFNPDIGYLYIPFAFLVIIGTSHAVNLTDGLDGLAIAPTVVSSATFMILAYITGLVLNFENNGIWTTFNVAQYLNIPHIKGLSEVAIICASIVGTGIGFLWYNTFPASVFMGDVGSLALGGVLGTIAIFTKNEFLSAIIHGVFLVEALSVIIQVSSFKLRRKRIFKMAPIHHHFEIKGFSEPKIIVRFWIISIILALIGLVTLKLR